MIESSMGNMEGTLKPESVLTKQRRIAELAKSHRGKAIISLNHYLDEEWLKSAYDLTRKDGAVGVDGQMAEDYEKNLQTNLRDLLGRMKSGRYKVLPVRRAYIPKADGTLRPLGIMAFEEKVAQRAIVMLLEPIYEQFLKNCSYGFRPNKSAHQALEHLRTDIMERGGRWILDVDLRRFFDTIDRGKLRELLAKRIVDGVITRLINKWLKAGVLEKDQLIKSDRGTIQGSLVGPILSNIILDRLDKYVEEQIIPAYTSGLQRKTNPPYARLTMQATEARRKND